MYYGKIYEKPKKEIPKWIKITAVVFSMTISVVLTILGITFAWLSFIL